MKHTSETKRAIADSFGDATDAYLQSTVHGSGEDLEQIVSWCRDASTVLDVATGAGHTAGAIARGGASRVVAADASPEMAATAARNFPSVRVVVGDAERLPFGTDRFDAVTCRIAAHHFPDPEAFVAEATRVLRPAGTFVLEDNVAPSAPELDEFVNRVESLRDQTHVRSHTTDQWHEWLTDAGATVEETVHLKRTLDFDDWVETQSLSEPERDRVEQVLLGARSREREFFEVTERAGSVESFANLKALVRCTLGAREQA